MVNNQSVGDTLIMNDYNETAIKNFNDNYSGLIAKNIASIAVKIVAAAIAADALSKKVEKASNGNALVGGFGRIFDWGRYRKGCGRNCKTMIFDVGIYCLLIFKLNAYF